MQHPWALRCQLEKSMRSISIFISLLFILCSSCKKNNILDRACFTDTANAGKLINRQAVIKLSGNDFYMYEQGTIDTKLIPCNLPLDFQVDDLQVLISGYTKQSREGGNTCCTEILFITKITR